jgi:hypothetical protein
LTGTFRTEFDRRLRELLSVRTGSTIPDDATVEVRTNANIVADYDTSGPQTEAEITITARWGDHFAETGYEGVTALADLIRDIDYDPEVSRQTALPGAGQ